MWDSHCAEAGWVGCYLEGKMFEVWWLQIGLYSTYSYLVIFVMFLNLKYNVNFYRNRKEKVLLHCSIFGGGFLLYSFLLFGITPCVYRRSDWHWGTQSFIEWHWGTQSIIEWQEALLSLKTHKTSGGSDNYVAMVIRVCVFLSQKGQWSVWYSNYFTSKFYL